MKYSTVEDVLTSFPHTIIPSVEGEPDYHTIHATRKFLQANSRAIDTHLGGGTFGHLGLIVSDAAYSNIAPPTAEAPHVGYQLATFGKKMCRPTGHAPPSSKL
jgi:hypothetical protein